MKYRYLLMSSLFIKGAVKWSMNKNTCKRDCIPLERKWEGSFRYLVIKIHYLDPLHLSFCLPNWSMDWFENKVCSSEKESHTSPLLNIIEIKILRVTSFSFIKATQRIISIHLLGSSFPSISCFFSCLCHLCLTVFVNLHFGYLWQPL